MKKTTNLKFCMSKQEKLDYVYYEKKKENIMSVQTDFEKEFETEEYEMLILVQASCGGAVCIKDMLKPSVDFLASIDLRNGQFFHEKGCVEWLIKKIINVRGGDMILSNLVFIVSLLGNAYLKNYNHINYII